MRRPLWLSTAVPLLLPAGALFAQQARGVVRDSAVGAPIPGVVVTVLDAGGASAARVITDAAGRFTVQAALSSPRLRLMRIGYRPRDVAMGADRGELVLSMEKIPPMLERIRVTDSEVCPGSPDRGAAFFLWDQARAGLLATVVSRDQKPAIAKTILYEQTMSPIDQTIRRQTKQVKSGRTTRPFTASAEPAVFARNGYMTEDARGRMFHAPDAEVLLHESFVATHCFRLLAADSAHVGQTGVAFTPMQGREALVDVTGVIWMDAVAAQLRSLDFTFTSLDPASMAARAGGHIEFVTTPNGMSIISRWRLLLANVQVNSIQRGAQVVSRGPPAQVEPRNRTDLRVVELVEAGGIVTEAKWPDGTVWVDTPTVARGVVIQRRSDQAVPGALVTLGGTADTVVSDTAGRFDLAAIPGRYLAHVSDTVLQSYVKPRSTSRHVVVPRSSSERVRIDLPPVSDVVDDICRGQRMGVGAVIITGLAATADATSLAGTRIEGRWQQKVLRGTGVFLDAMSAEVKVDEDGRFVVCGPARELELTLRLFRGSTQLADTTFVVTPVGFSQRVLWLVAPP